MYIILLMKFFRGSAIARIVGKNVVSDSAKFDSVVNMWVYEEIFNGEKLSEIINTRHENVKYLPGVTLPENVVCFQKNSFIIDIQG